MATGYCMQGVTALRNSVYMIMDGTEVVAGLSLRICVLDVLMCERKLKLAATLAATIPFFCGHQILHVRRNDCLRWCLYNHMRGGKV